MNLPEGVTEEEFLKTVEGISNQLCDKFKFGYYSREDIKQECFIIALDGLERYDPCRPLANFLYVHIRNRLCNFKRDKYFRLEKPCFKCPLKAYRAKDDFCLAYDKKTDCKYYRIWYDKNNSKQNIMNPIGISVISDENEPNVKQKDNISVNVATNEIFVIIDNNISLSMRKYWLQQKGGIKIPKKFYDLLMDEIKLILKENNINVSETW